LCPFIKKRVNPRRAACDRPTVLVHGRAGLKDGGGCPRGGDLALGTRQVRRGRHLVQQSTIHTPLQVHPGCNVVVDPLDSPHNLKVIPKTGETRRPTQGSVSRETALLCSGPLSRSNWNVAPARGPLPFRSAVKGGEVFPGRFLDPRSSDPIPTPYTATQHPWGLGPQPPYPTWRTKPIDSTYDRTTGCVRSAHTIRSAPACTC
jgi:hypothetical protein